VLAKILSAALVGLDAHVVEVEVDIGGGLPQFSVVGLPDATVRESRDRVRASLKNTGFSFPVKKITVNLAPADLKKEGSGYDLAIADSGNLDVRDLERTACRGHQPVVVPFGDDDLRVAGLVHCDVAGFEFQWHPCYRGEVPADRLTPVQTCRRGQSEGVLDQCVRSIQLVKRLPSAMRNSIDQVQPSSQPIPSPSLSSP